VAAAPVAFRSRGLAVFAGVKSTMLIVFIGPPGSGKGTQSKRLVERLQIPHLSTGELLRAAKKQDSPVGRLAAEYMDKGRLVPDAVVLSLVGEELNRPAYARGCLFDGFPRTVEQAESFDARLQERGTPLDVVIELHCDEQELTKRMLERAHKEGRTDDNPETIRERMSTYKSKTEPVLDYYRASGRLLVVDALGSPDEVFQRIWRGIEARQQPVK
jgi:adenylate kinase